MNNYERKQKLLSAIGIMTEILADLEQAELDRVTVRDMPQLWQKNIDNQIARYDSKEESLKNQPTHTSVRKRKNGLYELRHILDGKQKSIYARTLQQLYDKYSRQKKSKVKPTTRIATLKDWLVTWLETYKKGNVSDGFYDKLKRTTELHFGKIENVELKKLTEIAIQQWLNSITMKRTRETCCQIIKEALRRAVQNKLINENPAEYIKAMKSKRTTGQALTIEEQNELIAKLDQSEYQRIFLFLLYSGCRRSEALSICKRDIDYTKNTIHIKGTKTELSDRYIPLFDKVRPLLDSDTDPIFNYRADTLTRVFHKLCPTHKLHDLRHTFATRCIETGVALKTVQKWLGHSNIDMTANVYSHVQSEFEQTEADKINKKIP